VVLRVTLTIDHPFGLFDVPRRVAASKGPGDLQLFALATAEQFRIQRRLRWRNRSETSERTPESDTLGLGIEERDFHRRFGHHLPGHRCNPLGWQSDFCTRH